MSAFIVPVSPRILPTITTSPCHSTATNSTTNLTNSKTLTPTATAAKRTTPTASLFKTTTTHGRYLCPPRRPSVQRKVSDNHQSFYHRIIPRAGISSAPYSSREDDLHWKDRVALYAQFSAEETLHALLHALQLNARSGPHKDDGIDALYAFANVDIWALSHRFFGKKQDLGQFERFKRVVVAYPYNVLLRTDHTSKTLSALHVTPDIYVSRRAFTLEDSVTVFTFTMCRAEFGGRNDSRAWMVDSIIHDDKVDTESNDDEDDVETNVQ